MSYRTHPKTREYTNKLLEMLDDGLLDASQVVRDLVCYMSESNVQDFMECNGYLDDEEEEEEEEESSDELSEDFLVTKEHGL